MTERVGCSSRSVERTALCTPLTDPGDFDVLLDRVGHARVVMTVPTRRAHRRSAPLGDQVRRTTRSEP